MKRIVLVAGLMAAVFGTACTRHPEITSLQRKEAMNLASEAQFAMTLRDYPRTETLLTKATALCPDTGDLWLNLGSVRVQMKNREGARAAYRSALSAFEDAYRKKPGEAELLFQQIYVLALLGNVPDARARLEKAQKKDPDNRDLRAFIQEKQFDAMLADSNFKQIAL